LEDEGVETLFGVRRRRGGGKGEERKKGERQGGGSVRIGTYGKIESAP
jgi:hypothetical protein